MLIVETEKALQMNPRSWLITGAAGFVGSNLLLRLLGLGQTVVGLDNFSTGHAHNIEAVKRQVTAAQWQRFKLINGDICDLKACQAAMIGVDIVLHQAALGSVPRSLLDPISTHNSNINGFLNILVAARDAKVTRLVYAASSSTYGDHPGLPKVESEIGLPLSPYAVTKYVDELYANVFGRCYQTPTIGLRYFNVFGPYQDPEGAYAAVIPLWFKSIIRGEPVYINGDGETSRDFCFVNNVVQANLLAAVTQNSQALNQVYNIAVGQRTTLTGLYEAIREVVQKRVDIAVKPPVYREFRNGDIRHSLADVSKAQKYFGYVPTHTVREGLAQTADYYFSLFLENQERHHPRLQEMS